jgi:hypothetical protein
MIRIDEIYNNTFWPWLKNQRSGTRLFFCDPPGNTSPDALFNLGRDDIVENDYIFCHDQEPVHLDDFRRLFDEVLFRNWGLNAELIDGPTGIFNNPCICWPDLQFRTVLQHWRQTNPTEDPVELFQKHPDLFQQFRQHNIKLFIPGHVIVSEQGESVEQLTQLYGWQAHYYFYHGWAALDWYRGYDRTYLIARARDRRPTRTFMSPNRIVGGRRDHRVLFLYNVFKHDLQNNHISAPRICPYEGVDIASIAQKYTDVYPDIVQVFDRAELPRLFSNETELQMSSYQLTNFDEAADSLIYVATETLYSGRRTHLTEKTFRPIALEMPFVLVAPAHSLAYLKQYGFETFAPWIDETYDTIEDPIDRLECVTQILSEIQARSAAARQELWQRLVPIAEHNRNHFYSGAFAEVLWRELQAMLAEFK